MKKLLAVLLVLCLLPWAVAEDIDISGLSFEELRALQNRIAEEIVSRPEWKEVAVPPGLYQIGVDIPAGDWCLKCGKTEYDAIYIQYGNALNDSRTEVKFPGECLKLIYKQGKGNGEQIEYLNITLKDGYYISISNGPCIFTFPVRTDLGF